MLVAQSWLTFCDPTDCSPPGSSVYGILQARILEWVAIPFSRGSSRPRNWIWVSCIAGRFFTMWATREVVKQEKPNCLEEGEPDNMLESLADCITIHSSVWLSFSFPVSSFIFLLISHWHLLVNRFFFKFFLTVQCLVCAHMNVI